MSTDLTYTELADLSDKRADKERIERIKKAFKEFNESGQLIGESMIAAVNLSREMGLELQGIAGAEQMGFGFFTSHCAKDLPFGFEQVQRFISIARKMPEPAETPEDCVGVMQQVFFASELLKLPEPRTEQQKSHAEPPVPFTFNLFAKTWVEFEKRVKLEDLDAASREGLKAILDRNIQNLKDWREKL